MASNSVVDKELLPPVIAPFGAGILVKGSGENLEESCSALRTIEAS